MDRSKTTLFHSFKERDDATKKYYHSITPIDRLIITESLRQNYYENITPGFPRIFKIAPKA